jgi:hypothetical protein
MSRATTQGKRLSFILGVSMISSAAFAAGVDSRNYTCPELQRLILSNRFIFLGNPDFQDFVVADVSYCSGNGYLQLRSVTTRDQPECVVNYCVGPRGGGGCGGSGG